MVKENLTSVRILRKDAARISKAFNKSFKRRGIQRKAIVKPVGRITLKRLLTPVAFKEDKSKRRFGVFIKDK